VSLGTSWGGGDLEQQKGKGNTLSKNKTTKPLLKERNPLTAALIKGEGKREAHIQKCLKNCYNTSERQCIKRKKIKLKKGKFRERVRGQKKNYIQRNLLGGDTNEGGISQVKTPNWQEGDGRKRWEP